IVDSRCAQSRHALPLRPPGESESADRPPATCPALPNTHPGLFNRGTPRETFHQLAAGSRSQLSGAPDLPRQDERVAHRSGPGCGDLRIQPVRLFSRTIRGAFPVRVRGRRATRTRAVPRKGSGHPAVRRVPGIDPTRTRAHGRLSRCPKRESVPSHSLSDSHAARGAIARGDAASSVRLLPRLRLAARAAVASPWDSRTLRFRLSHSTDGGRKIAGWAFWTGDGFHGSACLVRGLPPGRRLDRPRSPSGLLAGGGHIPLACTPEPSTAAPISGEVEESEVKFEHTMKVERVWEAPRVTKPYTEAQWVEIERLGHVIDADLAVLDVRLTMGGEPTFVSIDDPDGAEWNTAALGESKRRLAGDIYWRLKQKYAPMGLTHFGQGKWYPGEPLPRWSLNCFWRRDGEPIWQTPELVANETAGGHATADTAQRFLAGVARRLGLSPEYVFAAYEDAFYYIWRERRLPSNVDPLNARLENAEEQARFARVFARGLDQAVGYVFPLARDPGGSRWQTGQWFLRQERCHLIPGDSALGYRLPLDSLPWAKAADQTHDQPLDPTQNFASLPRRADLPGQRGEGTSVAPAGPPVPRVRPPDPQESAGWITRTALCAEPRNGVLYIFMPPASRLEDYLELVSAVEATASELSQPVVVEGYEPPRDPRITNFRVTPDPGVIEVNIHPVANWDELVAGTTYLYEA